MNKKYYPLILAIVVTAFLPVAGYAEEADETSIQSETSIDAMLPINNKVTPTIIREKLYMNSDGDDFREQMLEHKGNVYREPQIKPSNKPESTPARPLIQKIKDNVRSFASSTHDERIETKDERKENIYDVRNNFADRAQNSTSTYERKELYREMRKDVFQIRKDSFIRQLNISLNNLKQISERIASRIEKATESGVDMSQATDLLIIADSKTIDAEVAINNLITLSTDDTSTASIDGSLAIDLTKPRELGSHAIQAIKEAHKAFVDVVRAIAHALGANKTATTTVQTTVQ